MEIIRVMYEIINKIKEVLKYLRDCWQETKLKNKIVFILFVIFIITLLILVWIGYKSFIKYIT